jgi:hypothetical protein
MIGPDNTHLTIVETLDINWPITCAICGTRVERVNNPKLICRVCGLGQNEPEVKAISEFKRKGLERRNRFASEEIRRLGARLALGEDVSAEIPFAAIEHKIEFETFEYLVSVQAQILAVNEAERRASQDGAAIRSGKAALVSCSAA